jgi:cbb3-type cytochrome oxidase subunit 3
MKRMIYFALGIVFFSFCFIAYAQLGQGETESVLDSMTISDIITASTIQNATVTIYDTLFINERIKIGLTLTEKIKDTIIIYDNAKAVYASIVQIIINLIGQTTNTLTFNWSIYTGTNATNIMLVENETNTLIKSLPAPLNSTWNYTFTDLSRFRQYTLFINATNGAANYTAYLDARTLMETGIISKWILIGFMGLLIILLYFYFFHDVIYFGVLAGVIMIFIAIVLGATGYLSDLSCVDNNIRETVIGDITDHDYHIICQESILDMDRNFINALALILLVIGSFIMVDFAYNINKRKAYA